MATKPKTKRDFSVDLRVLRAGLRLSQEDVAEQLAIGRDRYMRIENGRQTPFVSERRRLAKVLRTTEGNLEKLGMSAAPDPERKRAASVSTPAATL